MVSPQSHLCNVEISMDGDLEQAALAFGAPHRYVRGRAGTPAAAAGAAKTEASLQDCMAMMKQFEQGFASFMQTATATETDELLAFSIRLYKRLVERKTSVRVPQVAVGESKYMYNCGREAKQARPPTEHPFKKTCLPEARHERTDSAAERLMWCGHTCDYHQEVMNPALWSKLPDCTIEMIFARLPLADVLRLRSLSKHWKSMVLAGTSFQHAWSEVLAHKSSLMTFVNGKKHNFLDRNHSIFDTATSVWHHGHLHGLPQKYMGRPFASSGGLLCFVAENGRAYPNKKLSILVCNPLSCKWRKLRHPSHLFRLPKMVQIVVEHETKQYKVILVGHMNSKGTLAMEVYSSATKRWSLQGDMFVGRAFSEGGGFRKGLWTYNTEKGCVTGFRVRNPPPYELIDVAECDGHIYLLRTSPCFGTLKKTYCIWTRQSSGTEWSKLKELDVVVHASWKVRLLVCKGFFMLAGVSGEEPHHANFFTLYDVSKGDWKPQEFNDSDYVTAWSKDELENAVLCELRLDISP